MNPFITTLQIVGGILLPAIVVFVLWIAKELAIIFILTHEIKLEEARKKAPFDSVESSVRFQDGSLIIRLVKDDTVVYEDSISSSEMRNQ